MGTKLTLRMVEAARPQAKPYELRDGELKGLLLRVQPSGAKSFIVEWRRGKRRTLGRYPVMTLAAARTQAQVVLGDAAANGTPMVAKTVSAAPQTVADACRAYADALAAEGRTQAAAETHRRFRRVVYEDKIGRLKLTDLTQDDVEHWRDRLLAGKLKLSRAKGRKPEAKPLAKGSFNRYYTPLKAALNRVVERRQLSPERAIEWRSVKPYKGADGRRELYLDRGQRRALLNAAIPALRDYISLIMLTGCRPGDPAAVVRKDYDARHGTVKFTTKGHARTIPVAGQTRALLDRLAKSKLPNAPLFTDERGMPCDTHKLAAQVREAAVDAGLPEGVVMYNLRHSWITDAIVGGVDVLTVAKMSGTSLQMIDRHYGHLLAAAARDKLEQVQFI